MSIHTSIQWVDSSVNSAMGCDGCELFPNASQILRAILNALTAMDAKLTPATHKRIESLVRGKLATELYHRRKEISAKVLRKILGGKSRATKARVKCLAREVSKLFICYAGILHLRYGQNVTNPQSRGKKGFAPIFEKVTPFPGRMAAAAAAWSDLRGTTREEKPWLNGLPRAIFVSDMGDLLSSAVSSEYIRDEILTNVSSAQGRRHLWLWLTKRLQRMAKFSEWIIEQGLAWPDNLVAMTSVTSSKTVGRVEALKKVKCRFHGLSVEPLWSAVKLPLFAIDWVIVGGESGAGATPFQLEWARDIRQQCTQSGASFFLKQLGANPMEGTTPLKLTDGHGGDWAEWPEDLKVREMPAGFVM